MDLDNQRKSMEIESDNKKEGKEIQKVTNGISSADNSKSSQRVHPEAPTITKSKTEPKTSNGITKQDPREVKVPLAPTMVAPPKSGSSSTSRAVPLDTSVSEPRAGQSSASRINTGIKQETLSTDLKSGTSSQPASLGSSLGGSQHSSNFYPAQPAVINKSTAGPKMEVKHAQQKMMVNSPLSPSTSRKEMTSKTNEDTPQIYSHLSGRTIASEKGGAKSADPFAVKSDIEI